MGNGAKAAEARKRKEAAAKGAKGGQSQLKSNLAAQTIKCKVCLQAFQSTVNKNALADHATNKHTKSYDECFA